MTHWRAPYDNHRHVLRRKRRVSGETLLAIVACAAVGAVMGGGLLFMIAEGMR